MGEKRILTINGAILREKELEQHLEKFGATYNLKAKSDKLTYPIPRLMDNYRAIKETYELLNEHVNLGISIHPAGEWILDNFYIIEESVKCIEQELTKRKYKNFVSIGNGLYEGFARIYVLASEIVNYTDNNIQTGDLEKYLIAYQTKKTLNMDEIWSIGIFLQIALIENIRQICERIYIAQIEKYKVESIIERLVEKNKTNKFIPLKVNKRFKIFADTKYSFIEYLSYKLKIYGKETEKYLEILEEEVEKTGTTVTDVIKKEHFDIALRKVSIGNCITSIKRIQRINFLEIFEKINGVEEILKLDPANIYENMDYTTKDYYRQIIKEISKETKISEIYIAKKLLGLANGGIGKKKHIGYYLFGENKNTLYKKLGYETQKIMSEKQKYKFYISIIIVMTCIFSLLLDLSVLNNTSFIFSIIGFILLIIPISEIVIQIIQYFLNKIVKPKLIPKMDFSKGIDKKNKTMVVIPTILKNREKVIDLMRKLEVFYLANKSKNLYFCLLGDCTESDREIEDFDEEIVQEGLKQVQILNNKYKQEDDTYSIFNFAYRKRKWNESQSKFLGWERKRGALEEFAKFLHGDFDDKKVKEKYWVNTIKNFDIKAEKSNKKAKNYFCKYIITLDSDTELILNSAFEMVGAMAHILNKPEINNGKVTNGYGLIQPRVGVNIDISYKNMFTKIFAGNGGIDSYTNAVSDIYQDNFGEGIFTGKGIFDIETYLNTLSGEISENTVLSHDLLEGCYLRCGLATDILLMDGYPTKYNSFVSRLSRWIRGDWQIVKWLKSNKLNLLSKYKIFDNIRRSLFEVSTIICGLYFFVLGRVCGFNSFWIMFLLVFVTILPFLLEILNIVIFKKDGEQKQKTFTSKIGGIKGAIYRICLSLGCLPHKAYVSLKSICISVYRMTVSKKNLLEWTTSEDAERNAKNSTFSYYSLMWVNVLFGIFAVIASLFFVNNYIAKLFWLILGVWWAIIPLVMCDISTEKKYIKKDLNKEQKDYIKKIAKDTFSYFKDNLTKENNFLIPDNYQQDRKERYINRTSSTNIGLSLLVVMSGIDLGFIYYEDGLELLKNIIETIESLEKWNGHLYNWYNIKTKNPLIPRYVSTVDSGNFVGYLFVLKMFLKDGELRQRVNKLIEETDFSKLYSKEHNLFSIGFNVEDGNLTDSYYDLLASEARQASIVAIAKNDITSKHWYTLSRTLTILNNKKGLVSWAGTAFEYLMPNINIPTFSGSILDESCKFAIMSQIEYAKKLGLPW